ncbi:MAG TPA: hypothetical protein VM529_03770 [Gemmata sp.]|nr:hypothetical protein [Gemmata sp.]
MFVRPAGVFAVALVFLAGCGPAKLDESRSMEVADGEAKSIDLDALKKPQTITVDFTSSPGEVTVCVFKAEDCKTNDDLVVAPTAKAIAHKSGKSGTFTADIPENTATRVVVRNQGDKTKVDLKVTNKK